MVSHGGKGSGRRPSQIPSEQYASNWDAIFGKKKSVKENEQTNPDATEEMFQKLLDAGLSSETEWVFKPCLQ